MTRDNEFFAKRVTEFTLDHVVHLEMKGKNIFRKKERYFQISV